MKEQKLKKVKATEKMLRRAALKAVKAPGPCAAAAKEAFREDGLPETPFYRVGRDWNPLPVYLEIDMHGGAWPGVGTTTGKAVVDRIPLNPAVLGEALSQFLWMTRAGELIEKVARGSREGREELVRALEWVPAARVVPFEERFRDRLERDREGFYYMDGVKLDCENLPRALKRFPETYKRVAVYITPGMRAALIGLTVIGEEEAAARSSSNGGLTNYTA